MASESKGCVCSFQVWHCGLWGLICWVAHLGRYGNSVARDDCGSQCFFQSSVFSIRAYVLPSLHHFIITRGLPYASNMLSFCLLFHALFLKDLVDIASSQCKDTKVTISSMPESPAQGWRAHFLQHTNKNKGFCCNISSSSPASCIQDTFWPSPFSGY